MTPERNSTDSIPDIEMAELSTNDQSPLLMQTIMDQIDFSICLKFILIIIILNFMVPPIFIDFYYGIQAIEANQYTPCFFVELYFFCNGIVYSLLTFIAIVAIASVSDINRCITILLLMTSLIIFSFHVVWIVLIFKYF
jgi:hypothetical protein